MTQSQIEDSTVVGDSFMKGSGLGGNIIKFNEDGTFSKNDFCDICPSYRTLGYYIEETDQITLIDTLCYWVDGNGSLSFDPDRCTKFQKHFLNVYFIEGKQVLSELKRDSDYFQMGLYYRKL